MRSKKITRILEEHSLWLNGEVFSQADLCYEKLKGI
jgi:hypothetical protein